jgi:hypothetical protein
MNKKKEILVSILFVLMIGILYISFTFINAEIFYDSNIWVIRGFQFLALALAISITYVFAILKFKSLNVRYQFFITYGLVIGTTLKMIATDFSIVLTLLIMWVIYLEESE